MSPGKGKALKQLVRVPTDRMRRLRAVSTSGRLTLCCRLLPWLAGGAGSVPGFFEQIAHRERLCREQNSGAEDFVPFFCLIRPSLTFGGCCRIRWIFSAELGHLTYRRGASWYSHFGGLGVGGRRSLLERIIEDALATFGGRTHGAFCEIGDEKGRPLKDVQRGLERTGAAAIVGYFEALAGSTHPPAI